MPARDPDGGFRLVVEEYERWPEDAVGVPTEQLALSSRLVCRDAVLL